MSEDFDNSCIICMKEYNHVLHRKVTLMCMHSICITCTVKSFITLKCRCEQKHTRHIHCALCRYPSAKNDIIFDELDIENELFPPEEEEEEEEEEYEPESPLPPPPTPPVLIQVSPIEEVIVIDDTGAAMESTTTFQNLAPEIVPVWDFYNQLTQNPINNNNNYILTELEYIKQIILQLLHQ
uniref:RING-type domain-containing protein n=1 Tax=Panagrolaimus sp. PS1159 TaxID=55785 RepID=A0AC35FAZ2_9BILA